VPTVFIGAFPLASLELIVLRLNHGTDALEADKVSHLALARRRVYVRLIQDVVATTTAC